MHALVVVKMSTYKYISILVTCLVKVQGAHQGHGAGGRPDDGGEAGRDAIGEAHRANGEGVADGYRFDRGRVRRLNRLGGCFAYIGVWR